MERGLSVMGDCQCSYTGFDSQVGHKELVIYLSLVCLVNITCKVNEEVRYNWEKGDFFCLLYKTHQRTNLRDSILMKLSIAEAKMANVALQE